MRFKKVKLRKDTDYVYCFLKDKVIREEECDYYEHNLECDKNNDFWSRTHIKGTNAGYCIEGVSGSVLNDCGYCIKKEEKYEEYILPTHAGRKYGLETENNSLIDKIKKLW